MATGEYTNWTNIGTAADDFTVKRVESSPYPLEKGTTGTISLVGTLNRPLTGGTLSTAIKYGLVTVSKEQTQLDAREAGEHSLVAKTTIPADGAPGTYAITITATNEQATEICAVQIQIKI
ncbi:ML domain-containing protein [Streptomyces sp. NPDC087850]|uniref:ML domain-containing protein n=1 Tax=Streptomyces sp. NPDC087850 TaxID=3365809 RepID=UPI0037FCCA2D